MCLAHKHFPPSEPDYGYWEERGWHGKRRPWDGTVAGAAFFMQKIRCIIQSFLLAYA